MTNVDLEDDRDVDFDAGFTNEAKPEKPADAAVVIPADGSTPVVPAAEAQTAVVPAAEAAAVIEAPKYVQVTQAQWDALQAAAARTEGIDKRIRDTILGTVGDLEQKIIKKLQATTPAGSLVELPADIVSELEKDFPELAPLIKKTLEKAAKGLRGTGDQAETPDPKRWQTMVQEASLLYQKEALEDVYPQWREIVGPVTDGKHDPNNEYRKWLATQPAEYQHKVNNTNSAQVISRSIDQYMKAKETPKVPANTTTPAKTVARHNVIKGAVQPKGDGGQPAPTKTAEDEFEDGFVHG